MDRNFYARLKKAMSQEDALTTLGFQPGEHPSAPEIAKAYKSRILENHPDTGGSHEKMVALNVAKEVLDGKQRPTYERSEETSPVPNPWAGYQRREPTPKVVVSFDDAKAKAGLPGDVEWLFITDTQRGRDNYSGDESSKYVRAWVLYGKTSSQYVFLAMEQSEYSGLAGASDNGYDKWSMKSYEYPNSTKVTPSWVYGTIAKAFSGMQWFGGRFNSKVVPITNSPSSLTEETFRSMIRSGKTTTVKNYLVNNGAIAEDDPSIANRKVVVELAFEKDSLFGAKDPKPGFFGEAPGSRMWWDGAYHGDYYKFTLKLNGKEFVLNEVDTQKLLGLKMGGKGFMEGVFGTYHYGGSTKVITRMPKGKVLIDGFLKFLQHIPSQAREMLEKASLQMTK